MLFVYNSPTKECFDTKSTFVAMFTLYFKTEFHMSTLK